MKELFDTFNLKFLQAKKICESSEKDYWLNYNSYIQKLKE